MRLAAQVGPDQLDRDVAADATAATQIMENTILLIVVI